jgi:hypothetical protein
MKYIQLFDITFKGVSLVEQKFLFKRGSGSNSEGKRHCIRKPSWRRNGPPKMGKQSTGSAHYNNTGYA